MKTTLELVLQKDWEKQHNLKQHHDTEQNRAIRGRAILLDEITEGGKKIFRDFESEVKQKTVTRQSLGISHWPSPELFYL